MIIAAIVAAAAATIVVHALYRGARRRVVVATLKPFDTDSRPRLTLAPLTERTLLVCRLALLATVAATLWHERPTPAAGALRGDLVAVVPGTDPALVTAGTDAVWLDGSMTPLARTPRRADVTASALQAVAQSLPASAALTVFGTPEARDWPATMPAFGRGFEWRPASIAGVVPAADGWRDAGGPRRIVVSGDDATLVAAVRRAIERWRTAGLLPEFVDVEDRPPTNDAAAVFVGDADASGGWRARVVRAAAADGGAVVYDPAQSDGHGDAREVAASFRKAVAGDIAAQVVTPVASSWLLLLVVLFAAERALAARGVAA